MNKQRKNPVFLFLAAAAALNILAWLVVYDLAGRELTVVFFDVGQGDATLIKTPQGHHILIDGGPSPVILEKLGREMPFWKRSIDLIVLTHPHHDHLAGFIEVLKRYQVKNILWTGVLTDSAVFEEWQKLIQEEKTFIFLAKEGVLVRGGRVFLEILYPVENFENQKVVGLDNTSIVLKLTFGGTSFLFTGDASMEVERGLVKRNVNLDSDVLQVGHHGSRTSSSREFLEAASPAIAVISVGKDNKHGHPHQEVLENLLSYDINILRTDELGDIKIFSDGQALNLTTSYK